MANDVAASVATPPMAHNVEIADANADQPKSLIPRPRQQQQDRRRAVALAAAGLAAVTVILFVVIARVPIAAGWRQDRSLRVREVWTLFTQELAAVDGAWLSPVLISAVVIAILGACAIGLGLALLVSDEPPVESGD